MLGDSVASQVQYGAFFRLLRRAAKHDDVFCCLGLAV